MGDLARYAAANARIRTWLAAQLGRPGLEALNSYPTPATLRDALAQTAYGSAMAADGEAGGRLAQVGATLLRLLADPERAFCRVYLQRLELENLKIVIRIVGRGLGELPVGVSLRPLPEHGVVDAVRLARLRDLRELIDALRDTPYGPALVAVRHRVADGGPFALEAAVEGDYYDRLWAAAGMLRRTDAAEARQLLAVLYDILNLLWVARYRDGACLAPEEILNYLLAQGRWTTAPVRRRLAEAARGAWAAPLAGTPYAALGRECEARGFDVAVVLLWRRLVHESRRLLRCYPFRIGVPLAFLVLQEIEVRDVQTLVAARELRVGPAETLERLVTAAD
jgi:vacuolar-type H+-ATPase subunit C/Vma6